VNYCDLQLVVIVMDSVNGYVTASSDDYPVQIVTGDIIQTEGFGGIIDMADSGIDLNDSTYFDTNIDISVLEAIEEEQIAAVKENVTIVSQTSTNEDLVEAYCKKHGKTPPKRLKPLQSTLVSSYCAAARQIASITKGMGLTKYDESTTKISTTSYYNLPDYCSDEDRVEYVKQRSFEISSLYSHLGCSANMTRENQFGSYVDIAREAHYRRPDWGTTKVTAWLGKIEESRMRWNGTETPYSAVLPYVPPVVSSYLDYGCGSGNGAKQVSKYLGRPSVVHCYDIEDVLSDDSRNYNLSVLSHIVQQYSLVTMVNVLHHAKDFVPLMVDLLSTVANGGTLLIKDHFVNSSSIALAVLVHEMYEPVGLHDEPDSMYFRNLRQVLDYLRSQGWVVEVKEVPGSDVGDYVLVCHNLRDGGRAQLISLEARVTDLTQEVADLKLMVSKKFLNPRANDYVRPKEKTRRFKEIVANNDLSVKQPIKRERKPWSQQTKDEVRISSDTGSDNEQGRMNVRLEPKEQYFKGRAKFRDEVVVTTPPLKKWVPVQKQNLVSLQVVKPPSPKVVVPVEAVLPVKRSFEVDGPVY